MNICVVVFFFGLVWTGRLSNRTEKKLKTKLPEAFESICLCRRLCVKFSPWPEFTMYNNNNKQGQTIKINEI